jgi:hypothetical protein
MAVFDSTIRLRQANQPEFSGYTVQVIQNYLNGNPALPSTGVLSGVFYPLKSNPSGFVTSGQTGIFKTQIDLDSLYTQTIAYVAENYTSNATVLNTVTTTGNQTISGTKTFVNQTIFSGDNITGLDRIIQIDYRTVGIRTKDYSVAGGYTGAAAFLDIDNSKYGHLYLKGNTEYGQKVISLSSNDGSANFDGDVTAQNLHVNSGAIQNDNGAVIQLLNGYVGINNSFPAYTLDVNGINKNFLNGNEYSNEYK